MSATLSFDHPSSAKLYERTPANIRLKTATVPVTALHFCHR